MAVLAILMVTAGCGFHLRGTQTQTIAVPGGVHVDAVPRLDGIARQVEDQLNAAGSLAAGAGEAGVTLTLISETTRRRPVTSSGSGTAAQYEFELGVTFALVTRSNEVLIPGATVASRRIYAFDRESLVGNREEEDLLATEMRRELAGRIIGRVDAALREGAE